MGRGFWKDHMVFGVRVDLRKLPDLIVNIFG